jgi:nucleoside-diphosphate-sugar epimerase
MARTLVTGAAGFIGSNLIRSLLARGDEVHACVRRNGSRWRLPVEKSSFFLHEIDLLTKGELAAVVARTRPDVIYHLSHYGGNRGESDEATIRAVIIDGTAELYEACLRMSSFPNIVTLGSSSEYGKKHEPMKESMVPEPNTAYGCARLWASLYAEHLRREQGVPITSLRLFSAYGPFEAKTRLIPAVILALLHGEMPELSNPQTARDFIYVEDVVDALILASQAKKPGLYNIGTGINTTLESMVARICSQLEAPVPTSWGASPGQSFDTDLWVADTSRTEEMLGWSFKTGIDEGTSKTIDWFKKNRHLYA